MTSIPRLFYTLISVLAFSIPPAAFAGTPRPDTTIIVGDHSIWHSWDKRRPVVEFGYGVDQARHKRLSAEFPTTGMMEFRAGYLRVDSLDDGILKFDHNFLMGSWYNANLGGDDAGANQPSGKLSRFGLGYDEGYGYDLGGSSILPYSITTISWTELKTGRPLTLSADDAAILDRYEGTFRFGPSAEAGIRANIGRTFALSGGYEASVLYPRIVFWELAGSFLVAGVANEAVSWFGRDMIDSSPTLGPIFLFIIRSGVTWGFYQLWREDMNWPFGSETPLTHETVKFTMSFTL
jgi:hypothetical protein